MTTLRRLLRAARTLARDSRIPRTLCFLLVAGTIFGPLILGPFDEIVALLVLVLLVAVPTWRRCLSEAWEGSR